MGGHVCCRGHDTCPKTGVKLRKSTLEPDVALKTEVNRWLKEQTAAARADHAYHEAISKQASQVPARVESAAEDTASVGVGGISLQDPSAMPGVEPTAAASLAQQPAQAPLRSIFADLWAARSGTETPRRADAEPDSPAADRSRPLPLAATGWADIVERQASPATPGAAGGDAALGSDHGEEDPRSSSCNSKAGEVQTSTAMG